MKTSLRVTKKITPNMRKELDNIKREISNPSELADYLLEGWEREFVNSFKGMIAITPSSLCKIATIQIKLQGTY